MAHGVNLPEDRAALRWHDFALRIVKDAGGEMGFEVYAGGGMGRTPFIAYRIRDFLPTGQILSYLQAVLRVWNRNARRDNIHKQRMKILVHDLGQEEFTRQVEEEWADLKGTEETLTLEEMERVIAYFQPHPYEQLEAIDPRAGHIPGAVSAPWSMNLDERGRFRAFLLTAVARFISKERDKAQAEWGRLILEQSTWTAHSRIEVLATEQLKMRIPGAAEVQMVAP